MNRSGQLKPYNGKWPMIFSAALIAILALVSLHYRDQLTVDFFVQTIEQHSSAAALALLILYLLKTFAFLVPIVLLYMAGGLMFSPVEALLLNSLGILMAAALPYFAGRYYGTAMVDRIYRHQPRLQSVVYLQHQDPTLFAFVLRITGVIPVELASMFMGALATPFRPYLRGSLLGLFPNMLLYTLLGHTITDPSSPVFMITLVFAVGSTVLTAILYPLYLQRQYKKQGGVVKMQKPTEDSQDSEMPDRSIDV
ncbi:MAG: VTT domain-containing protein [Syntrophomonadaceae bacterium]